MDSHYNYITKIKINNVRHLKNIEIPLSETECKHLIITGKNGSGKTSLLEALRLFLLFHTADDQYIVHNGDIVVGMDGEFHINSWSGGDAYLVQRTCSFRPHDETMKGYLLQAIYEPIKFFEKTLVGATVAHLGKKNIDTIRLLIPPPKYYQQFEKGYKLIQNLREQNILLQEARDRLLPKLMSGEIEL